MRSLSFANIITEKISTVPLAEKNTQLSVLRLDQIHPYVSGNKWFKLQYYLNEALELNKKVVVTYGGAWSNHILATAAACKMMGLQSVGLIRGKEAPQLSSTLLKARECGMELSFMSREDYKKKELPLQWTNDRTYLIPEGGYGQQGARGAADICNHFDPGDYSHIACAVGTGTTMAGIINGCPKNLVVLGISVMKNNLELEKNVAGLLNDQKKEYAISHDYSFGSYAKYNTDLLQFMNEWYSKTGIPTDFVYTGKLLFAVNDLIRKNFFPEGSRILVIHSGGLPGNVSLEKGTLIF